MSLKYSSTTADYLVWSDAMNLIRKLAKDENYKISLLIALFIEPSTQKLFQQYRIYMTKKK